MKKKTYLLTSLLLIATLILAGFTSTTALAESMDEDELEYSGIVEELFGDGSFSFRTEEDILILVGAIENGSFQLKVGEDDPLTILVEVGFEFGEIVVGDEFEIEAKLNENEEWELYKFKIQEQEQEREEEGYFCSEDATEQHPVALGIAETYGVDYDTVITMFCNGSGEEEGSARTGFGQIMLAFQTAEETGGTAEEILSERLSGKGWGQIWQDMDLIGKPDDVGPPEGKGKPNDVGPPEDAGKPEDVGKPDHAGPKQ